MTDLHDRFRTLDKVATPDLWHEIEEGAVVTQPMLRRLPWVLIAAMLLLALAIGGAALVGSGIVKLPVSFETPPAPFPTSGSPAPSATAVAHRAPAWTATGKMIVA